MWAVPDAANASWVAWCRHAWQRWHQQVLAAFSLAVLGVVAWRLRALDWSGAWRAAHGLPASALATATVVALLGHLNYGAFDLLAWRWLALRVPRWQMAWIGTISYAFTLNLGSLIGGAAVRGRLLTAAGLGVSDITRVVTLALLTNWLGYAAVTGWLLCLSGGVAPATAAAGPSRLDDLQAQAQPLLAWLDSPAAGGVGAALLAVAAAWLLVCAHPRAMAKLQAAGLQPPLRWLAAAQLGLGAANWMWMAGVMASLLNPLTIGQVPARRFWPVWRVW